MLRAERGYVLAGRIPAMGSARAIPKCYTSKLLDLKPGPKDSSQKNLLGYTVVGLDFLARQVEKSVSHLVVLRCPNGLSHFGILKQ